MHHTFCIEKINPIFYKKSALSLCLSALFYPEIGDKFVSCCRLQCRHTFHEKCMEQMIAYKHNKCPECR